MTISTRRALIGLVAGTFVGLSTSCTRQAASPEAATLPAAESDAAKLERLKSGAASSPSYENHIALGLELSRRRNFDEAIESFKKARDLNPKAPLAWNNICAAYNDLKRYADAVEICEKATALDPSFQFAKNNLAEAKAQLEKLRALLEVEKPVLMSKLAVMSTDELVDTGFRFFEVRELPEAVTFWKRVPAKDPKYATAQNNLASAYILLRDFASADKALAEAIAIDPKNQLFANNKKWLEDARGEKR